VNTTVNQQIGDPQLSAAIRFMLMTGVIDMILSSLNLCEHPEGLEFLSKSRPSTHG
jgi:hypothetical protein